MKVLNTFSKILLIFSKCLKFCLHDSSNKTHSTTFFDNTPVDTGRKLNLHKTFNLRPVSTVVTLALK